MKSLLALTLISLAAPALAAAPTSHAKLVQLGITSGGIILRTDAQSCTDKMQTMSNGTIQRSIQAPVMSFAGLSVLWKSTDMDLYIGTIQIKATSPEFPNGEFIAQLDSTEAEALLGAPAAIIPRAMSPMTPTLRASTSMTKGKNAAGFEYAPCGLAVGSLSSNKSAKQFTTDVEVTLIGTAHADNGRDMTITQTVKTQATFY